MARTERGDQTRAAVQALPTPGGGAAPAPGKFIGVSDDYVRTTTRQVEDPNNPHRRVAPGVIRGGTVSQTVVQRPQYNQAFVDAQMANMSPEEVFELQKQMARAGFIGPKERFAPGMWDTKTKNAFKDVLELANTYTTDVQTALQMAAQGSLVSGGDLGGLGGGGEAAPFTGSKKQRDKRVDLTNPQAAKQRLRSMLREELGRAPSPQEVAEVIAALNAAERANPQISDSTVHYEAGEVTGSETTTSGGVDPDAFMEDFVLQDPELSAERNSFMRDTDYYQAAMSVLGEGGGAL